MKKNLKPKASIIFCMLLSFAINCKTTAQNYRSSNTSGAASGILILTINKPTGTVNADVMIAAVTVRPSTATITAPSGWTLIRETMQSSGTTSKQATYWKAAGESEPASYTFTLSASTGSAGGISTFYNINTSNPVNIENGQATGSSLSHAAPSVTTTVANTMVIATTSFVSSATWTAPTGMTEAFDRASNTVPNVNGVSLQMSYVNQAPSGATGIKTATASNNANVGVAQIVTLVSSSSATIAYSGSPYCTGGGTANVTQTGTSGGTYTSTAGLTINASTGAITLGSSTPGIYTVTYTYGGIYTTTTSLTVNSSPNSPGITTPVNYCQNATALPLTASGTNLLWGGMQTTVGGTTILSSVIYIDGTYNNRKTNFTTTAANISINTVDYYIPSWQAVNGIVLSIYNSSGIIIATSSTNTTLSAGAATEKVTSTFNYILAAAGNYSIGVSAGTGNVGYDNPSFPITEPTGRINITSVSSNGNRCFNNILFTPGTGALAPTPSTSTAGTIAYPVTQTVNGCTSAAATINVIVSGASAISQVPVVDIIGNYRFEGNADDEAASNNGTLQNSPSLTSDRFGNAGKAYSFNGSSQYISTENQYLNPVNFTISVWFKTSTATGGKLVGFGVSKTGESWQYDRHIYMNNTGQIYFGVYPSVVRTINSALSYNDNNWHLATATLSSAGMILYVDGTQVAADPSTTTAETTNGYWRIGYDNNNGWTSQPSTFYFNGSLDDVLIYHTALSASEVFTLYNSPDGAGNDGPVCTGSTVTLNATPLSGATYSWTGPDGFTSTSQNPYFTHTTATTGTYTLAVTAAGCTSTAWTNVKASSNAGQWTGNASNNWADGSNWCSGVVPTASSNVIIPSSAPRMPVISSNAACNNLTINAGATLTTAAAATINIAGLLTNNGTMANNGNTNFNGTTGQQTFTGVTVFNNLTLTNTSSLILPAAITVNGNLTIASGTLNANNFNVVVQGNWTNNVSTTAYSAGSGTVSFSGSVVQVIGGTFATTFNNLIIANTGNTVSLNTNITVTGNLSVNSGTFNLLTFTANRNVAGGILTVSNNAVLKIGGTNTFPSNYSTNTLVVASTVEYAGTNQAVSGKTYGNLVLSSSSGAVVKTFPGTALTVLGNFTSTAGSGTAVSFTAASNITVDGNIIIGASTTFNGGSFSHNIGGNWTNSGTFNGSTGTVNFTGSGAVVSGGGAQNFNNLTVSASLVSFSSSTITLTGNLATISAGSFTHATGGTLTMTGASKTISGGGISLDNLNVSGSVSTTTSMSIAGNLSISGSVTASGGTITMSGVSKTISGAGTKNFRTLSITGAVTTAVNFSVASGLIVSGGFTASAGTATFTGSSSLSGTANLYNTIINGTSLQLSAGSTLGIANALTITAGTVNVSSSIPNTVNFNGTVAQNINAITYCNLVLSNGNAKTALGNLTTNYHLNIATGTTFTPGAYTHTIKGNWTNNGTFIPGTSTIQFAGPATAYITGETTFNILTSNTGSVSTELICNNNITAAIVNMTTGIIYTASNTLTITNTRTGNGYIYGNINRTHSFTTGVAYAFEGPANTVTFSAVSAVTSITVSVNKGSISDFPFGNAISRLYDITVPYGTYTATLRLHYLDDELNGNTEADMGMWNYDATPQWIPVGKTANSTTANYIESSGLTNITSRWTCSINPGVVLWNGSVSTDWNTAANWTVYVGSASAPPSSSDVAVIGGIPYTYPPSISNAANVKNLVFGSNPITLNMAPGGSLTSADIQGVWNNNAVHTINVNNQTITVNGNLALSDYVANHVINLNIGNGTLNVNGSIIQSGGANIIFTGAGNINVSGNFTYVEGTFTPGGGTVTYNGSVNQAIGAVNYNNLTINNAAALVSINAPLTVYGNLSVVAGELDNYAVTNIYGNVNISPGANIFNNGVLYIGGNWNNYGSYVATGAQTIFNGSGTQTITATTFNNLVIHKPLGSTAELTGNAVINGDLTVKSGIFNIKTFDCNRSVQGGTLTLADSATFIVSANNSPLNFANGTIADSSTVIADGTVPQFIFGLEFGNIIFRNAGIKTLISPITVKGNVLIESGSNFDAGDQTLTLKGHWINSGNFTPSTSTILCTGAAKNISGNNTFNMLSVVGSYTFLHNNTINSQLTINATGSLSGGSGIHTTMNGDLVNKGILYTLGTTTFTGNVLQTMSLINAVQTVAIIVNFNGSVSPILNSTSTPQYGYLNINNTGGVNPSVGWTVAYGLTTGTGASFNGGISTHNILGYMTNNGTISSSGTINFIPSSAVAINFGNNFSSTGTVNIGGSGAITLSGSPTVLNNLLISNTNVAGITSPADLLITSNFTVNNGSIFNAGNHTYSIGYNILNNGIINSGTSTFILNGTDHQDIYSNSPFYNLTINKPGNAVELFSNITTNAVLNFVSGNLETGTHAVILPSTGSVTGAAQNTGWVNGNLQKNIATGATVKTFEIGDASYYTPVSLAFANVSTAGNITASTTGGDHPSIGSSTISPSKSVNRYYTLTNSGVAFTNYHAVFNFSATDVDAGATTGNFDVENFTGSSWLVPTSISPLATSIEVVSLSATGNFAIGEICNKGTTIVYAASPYCNTADSAIVTINGTPGGSFSSGPGLSINTFTGTIDLSSSTLGTYTVTYTIPSSGDCGQYITSATIVIGTAGSWTGAVNTDWNNTGNWSCGSVPDVSDDVTIPSGLSNYPVITGLISFHNITIQGNASLSLTGGKIKIAGIINNWGTLNASSGTIEMNGSSPQIIPTGTFANNTIRHLIISNTIALHGTLIVTGEVSFGTSNSTIYTGDHLVLKSTAAGTARISDITKGGAYTGNTISGKVTVERYIPAKRAWRLMAAPVSETDAPTINESWQEGATSGDPKPGYGLQITGGTQDNGYDIGVNSNPSLKLYNNSSSSYIGLPAMPGTNVPITSNPAYFLFVRGGRNTNLSSGVNAPVSPTTLRIKGNINTGNINAAVNANGYTLVGNPYPSPVDFHQLTKVNVNDKFYVWDPKLSGAKGLGAYVTLIWNGSGYDATSSVSAVSQHIQSGEAFFVESANQSAAGTLGFKETDKSAGGSDNVFRPVYGRETQRINLYALTTDGDSSLSDAVLVTYQDNNSNAVDKNDAIKMYNMGENICIGRDGKLLSIERRATIDGADTTFLSIYNLKLQKYKLQITTQAMETAGVFAVLKDNYSQSINNTAINLGGVTDIEFSITADPASYAVNRFSIVFSKLQSVLPVSFISVKARQVGKDVLVEWTTANEVNVKNYRIQSSVNGVYFYEIARVDALGGSGNIYNWTDTNVTSGLHYYRIQSMHADAKVTYSGIEKVMTTQLPESIMVYPNPVTNGVIQLQFNNCEQGKYKIRLINSSGIDILSKSIQHLPGDNIKSIQVPGYNKGIYQLEIIKPGNEKVYRQVSIL